MYKRRYVDNAMEYLAIRELKRYRGGKFISGEPCAIPIEEIIEIQYGISIEYHYLRKNLITLGQMVFDGGFVPIYDMEKCRYTLIDVPPKTMLVDIRLVDDKRYENKLRFTYAHELAHYIIHKERFSNCEQSPALIKGRENEYTDRIEQQANMFSSYLLVPTGQMKKAFNRLMAKRRGATIIADMAELFGVAQQTIRIRLNEHGLI